MVYVVQSVLGDRPLVGINGAALSSGSHAEGFGPFSYRPRDSRRALKNVMDFKMKQNTYVC